MQLTEEQIKNNTAAVEAHLRGRKIEFKRLKTLTWNEDTSLHPDFAFNRLEFRPKPEPVTRPWSKPEDVPGPVCWLRIKENNYQQMIVGVSFNGFVVINCNKHIKWEDLCAYEYSLDRRQWHPCTVTEP